MPVIQEYQPSPVNLPIDSQVTRRFYDPRSHFKGKPPLTNEDYLGYETHCIFHDVYLDATSNKVRAIGPPLVNLAKHLLPLKLYVVDAQGTRYGPIRHHIAKKDRVTLHWFNLPKLLEANSTLQVTFDFANGLTHTEQVTRQTLPEVELQFVTLQKDNCGKWIEDWLTHCFLLGAKRVVLYDNDSENTEELKQSLRSCPLDLDITLVHWPYAYGPMRSQYNKFCQASQNNHVYTCFGAAQWTGHFDVDEFLVPTGKMPLLDLLRSSSQLTGLFRFDSYWIPNITANTSESLITLRDFPYRDINARGKAKKYIARNSALTMANTHNGRVRIGSIRRAVKKEAFCFYHYKGLTTGWKTDSSRANQEQYDAQIHTADPLMKQIGENIDGVKKNQL